MPGRAPAKKILNSDKNNVTLPLSDLNGNLREKGFEAR
ncbi:hypothetical protein Cabys_3366 [Caldithrix abyssi DSM 13497]|uniref:Uncharacterized protein n=1 Tax=Caldithrix abyssi DSM 13497 TaxID=880073 RepID=A0A1J1CDQ1_CALAY|nr:hypothetical protein Cabys_3366 [Caldithrix abyssi DSM 13497]